LIYGPKRVGDIQDSLADITAIHQAIGYEPIFTFEEGISHYLAFNG